MEEWAHLGCGLCFTFYVYLLFFYFGRTYVLLTVLISFFFLSLMFTVLIRFFVTDVPSPKSVSAQKHTNIH